MLSDNRGGATLEFTLFLCATSILLVMIFASLGNSYKQEIIAWYKGEEAIEIDTIAVGSIRTETVKDGKNYRVITMPASLKTNGEN